MLDSFYPFIQLSSDNTSFGCFWFSFINCDRLYFPKIVIFPIPHTFLEPHNLMRPNTAQKPLELKHICYLYNKCFIYITYISIIFIYNVTYCKIKYNNAVI